MTTDAKTLLQRTSPARRVFHSMIPAGCLGALLWLVGCAGVPAYPPQLPALSPLDEKNEMTVDLAGKYLDRGTALSKHAKPLQEVSLTQLLRNPKAPPGAGLPNGDVVVVVGPKGGVVEVQSWQGDKQFATTSLRKATHEPPNTDHYGYQKGYLKLTFSSTAGVSPLVSGGGEESLWLGKAVDGSLVVLHRNTGFWLVVNVVPVWRGHTEWYRFAPVSGAATSGTGGDGSAAPHHGEEQVQDPATVGEAPRASLGDANSLPQ